MRVICSMIVRDAMYGEVPYHYSYNHAASANGDSSLFLAVAGVEYRASPSCHRSIPAQDRRLAIRNCLRWTVNV